ncbi:MAG: Uncharacterized protein E1N59_1731 [Puniceicoccaceae bacterium 5H]|nr:MAG: Uncharacterized protein E1N59_1731 [Puniceicoccaceae bacterium 5H]
MSFWAGPAIWVVAAVAGLVVGSILPRLWFALLPMAVIKAFFTGLLADLRTLFQSLDDDNFHQHYLRLVRRVLGYLGRSLLALVVTFGPLILLGATLGLHVVSLTEAESAAYAVYPAATEARVTPQGDTLTVDLGTEEATFPREEVPLVLHSAEQPSAWLSIIPAHHVDSELANVAGRPLVIRAAPHGWNVFWPWISGLEFVFYGMAALGSCLQFVVFKPKDSSAESGTEGMDVPGVEYELARLNTTFSGTAVSIGNLETRLRARKLQRKDVERPVFITGLARAGTTFLLELVAEHPSIAAHCYRDYPFLMTPLLWNGFVSRFAAKSKPVERAHKDGIFITADSPEALEEPIWMHFFPHLHEVGHQHSLAPEDRNAAFDRFYREHLQKILLLRQGTRYLSKGNYNVTRIPYLARLFPDAVFIVPIRHPHAHVYSLMRQHQRFVRYAELDPRVPEYMKNIGHFEFGPHRQPIDPFPGGEVGRETRDLWSQGEDAAGYAVQWEAIYRYVWQIRQADPQLAKQIHVLRYEDICAAPETQLKPFLQEHDLWQPSMQPRLEAIRPATQAPKLSDAQRTAIDRTTRRTAALYGYELD